MTKKENTKIEIRKEILQLIRSKYDNICVGDYDAEELEVVQQELKEIAEMVRDKDKLMKIKKSNVNKNVERYFSIDK